MIVNVGKDGTVTCRELMGRCTTAILVARMARQVDARKGGLHADQRFLDFHFCKCRASRIVRQNEPSFGIHFVDSTEGAQTRWTTRLCRLITAQTRMLFEATGL